MFTAKVTNYFGKGNQRTDYPDGGWSWNILYLEVSKYKIRLIQDRDVIGNKIKAKGMIYTTDVEIDGVTKYEEGVRVVNDLCRILSFASFSQVVPFSYSFDGYSRRISISAEAMNFRPLIHIKDGKATQKYVEQVWSKYRKEKRTRKLGEVIEMLTISELPVQPLEVKLAQIFIILENLKTTYARSKKIPFKNGFFRKLSSPPKPNLKKEKKYSFNDLLNLMFSEVGMKPNLKKIANLRNEIIHFGLSRKPYQSLSTDYEFCHDIVREYLLRFLQYEGKYKLYSSAARITKQLTSCTRVTTASRGHHNRASARSRRP